MSDEIIMTGDQKFAVLWSALTNDDLWIYIDDKNRYDPHYLSPRFLVNIFKYNDDDLDKQVGEHITNLSGDTQEEVLSALGGWLAQRRMTQ